jgi:alkaline phosphatase D
MTHNRRASRPPSPLARASLHRPLLAPALALAAAMAHADVAQGPMVQAVTNKQAGVWVRTTEDQAVRVRYTDPAGNSLTTDPVTTSLQASDDTASFLLTGLASGTRYTYQVGTRDPESGVESWTGNYAFETVSGVVKEMHIAVLSDFRNGMKASDALQKALDWKPDLLAIIGDLDHRDPARDDKGKPYPPEDAPLVLDDMRKMHRDARDPSRPLGRNFFSGIVGAPDAKRPQTPWVYAWDDHDYCANNTDQTCTFRNEAVKAYDEYYVAAPDNAFSAGCSGDFQSLTYGKLVQVFFLDARSQSDALAPDGPTAMLGACQHAWLVNGLHASKATWKIVMSPVPINATTKTYDSWAHFPNERAGLLAEIADVPHLVFVSGDIHSGGAIDEGEHSGRPEVSTPHAGMPDTWDNTYCRNEEHTTLLSRPGSWSIGGPLDPIIDVKPMQCLAQFFPDDYPVDRIIAPVYPLDGRGNPGFVWIGVTPTALNLTVRDVAGHVKQGVRADGSAAALKLNLLAP